MKIALAQLNFRVGDFEANTRKMLDAVASAKQQAADIIVFSELAIGGYPAWDFLEFRDFIRLCNESISTLSAASESITIIVGAPSINPDAKGKDLFNSAYVITEGRIEDIIHKSLLPTYDIFDEYRYFEPNVNFHCITVKGQKIALTICEDLWNSDENPLYKLNPMDELIKENPVLAINIAASPFSVSHGQMRDQVLRNNALKYKIPFYYVNHVGAQTELIFDGSSKYIHTDGKILAAPSFAEDIFIPDLLELQEMVNNQEPLPNKYEILTQALTTGIRDYFRKLGFSTAIIGLSGGIDSALVFALAVQALGKDNVLAVLMPSAFTSESSNSEALEMVSRLGAGHKIIAIEGLMSAYDVALAPHFEGRALDVTEENLQARIRGSILMALSNKLGYIVLNTSNKSELAVGYSTLYGDSIGAISVLGDIYKTEVFELSRYINEEYGNIIPEFIISRPPSAELRADQKDSDSLPEYEILDKILFEYIENRRGPAEIAEMGFDMALVNRILKLVNQSEYKRFQAPPILRVSDKAFGIGRRLPIVAKYLS